MGTGTVGDKITKKEKGERKLFDKNQLIAGLKEVTALFEEADGIWINLQGKDRTERLEENKKKAEKQNKEFNPKMKIKTELKLHVMYEGWKKDDPRHSLVNKHPLDKLLKELGIKHHKIQPRTPEHNGKVERSHRNDNERFYSYLKFYSFEDLQEQGARYLKRSNNIPMAVLGYLTPKEKRAELEVLEAA